MKMDGRQNCIKQKHKFTLIIKCRIITTYSQSFLELNVDKVYIDNK